MTRHCFADSLGVGDRESREVAPVEERETIRPNVYDDRQVAQRYDAARALPVATLDLWMHTLQQLIPQPIDRIVDVGCGTGRFTCALATTFGCATLGIDPAGPMLQAARATHGPAMHWVQAAAEAIPVVSDTVDVVWLSQVMHHLQDWTVVCRELHRVLRSDGYMVVRNGTQETNAMMPWLRCFPEAAALEQRRIPSRQAMIDQITAHAYDFVALRTVWQAFASSAGAYYDKIAQRGLSSLISISDGAFASGLQRLRVWANAQPGHASVYEPVDVFVFAAA
jgi:ubiquinone/menaquinone biosynthesis C-methylase UbiE